MTSNNDAETTEITEPKSDFVPLHVHSHFSLLNALPKIDELVQRAQDEGHDTLALTDDANLYGAIEFYKACDSAEVKPIIGVHFYVAIRSRHDKQGGIDNKYYRLICLAKNENGYKNLIQLVTKSHLEGFYYKPRIDDELIKEFGDDLVAILPTFSSETTRALENENPDKAKKVLQKYKEVFGDDLYLELSRHPEIAGHDSIAKAVEQLAGETDTPVVASQEVYYLDPDDREARETLCSIQSSRPSSPFDETEEDFSFPDTGTIRSRYSDIPEALENTKEIAKKCNLTLTLGEPIFPDIKVPEDSSYEEEFRQAVYDGIDERGLERTDELMDRIEYELGIIEEKGYSSYFLVVADLLEYAHDQDILTTIRGSVAGSLVTFLVGITNFNPLDYGLRFERFLNPQRPSAPDIDMDFADDRRDEVIEYAREKYGRDKVAQIGTFGTMAARGSVRDVTRALGYSYNLGDNIAKKIPLGSQGFKMTIEKALEMEDELKELYENESDVRRIIDFAKKIEGCARHISVHAAGVVISPDEITQHVPLQVDNKKGARITQYDMYSIADEYGGVGLVKFDFLGLKNLSILADAIKRVKRRTGEEIDIEAIPLDDETTFELLGKGMTHSTFQLNGEGMTQYLKKLKPTNIHDINAMVALYRPGPMKFIPEYIKRKHNPGTVEYPHPDLKDVLERSYGLLIYQEDVMMTAIKLAGYSWLEADKFRKAMGKKIPELMAKQEKKFKEGCVENGISQDLAENLWERIKPFAAYAFNKAHAASYGRVAYQTAYMKANYPHEYMSAVLTADAGNVDKISDIISECERMGIEVLAPDINASEGNFTIVEETDPDTGETEEKIRFGLYSIKNFGEGIADIIIAERTENGPFKSLEGFLDRVQDRNLNKKSLESLIKCGALDSFADRAKMLHSLDGLLEYNKQNRDTAEGQDSLFGLMEDESSIPSLTLEDCEPAGLRTILSWEKDLLGLYISGHPLDPVRDQLENRDQDIAFIKKNHERIPKAIIPGLIEEVKTIRTKKGDQMAFVKISDLTDSIEMVAFPDGFAEYKELLEPEQTVVVQAKISTRNDEISLILDRIRKLE